MERIKTIEKLCEDNNAQIRALNKVASERRQPMSKADKQRCQDLRNANYYLGRAKFLIVQTLANKE